MAPLKKVESLAVISNRVVSRHIADLCIALDKRTEGGEGGESGEAALQPLLLELPAVLLDSLVHATVTTLLRPGGVEGRWQRNIPATGLHVALRLLPQRSTSVLDLGALFTGARLSRQSNTLCRAALVSSLGRATQLTKLVLSSKASNDLLEVVGRSCRLLAELHISMSELVTDPGLAALVPSVSRAYSGEADEAWCRHQGCPRLVVVDLTKCWNVSPSGARMLLLGLKNLKKLIYSNMKSILESFEKEESQPEPLERIEYFDSSEYSLLTDMTMDCDLPESDPAKWMTGPVRLSAIPRLFPNVTILKMMLSDAEVQLLVSVPRLLHLELEFSDDPGPGLQHLLDTHPNIENFALLFLQVGPILASHLLSIATNCVRLSFLRIIGFQIENSGQLKPSSKYFQTLTQLWLSFYDDTYEDSDDDENGANGHVSRHTPEMIEFFLLSDCSSLKTVNIHMNVSHFLNDLYLHKLLSGNPLRGLTRLGLTAPDDLPLTVATVRWLLDCLPSVQSLSASKWKINHKQLKILQNEAQENNLDVVYD